MKRRVPTIEEFTYINESIKSEPLETCYDIEKQLKDLKTFVNDLSTADKILPIIDKNLKLINDIIFQIKSHK